MGIDNTMDLLSQHLFVILIVAYLVGTLPGALIVCKLLNLPDPRQHGSENPGSTNVARLGGKKAGFLTFVIDCSKGLFAILIVQYGFAPPNAASPEILGLTALAVSLGHCYPIWFKGKGGKGVATFFGAILAMSPMNAAITALSWGVLAKTTSYVSVASLAATLVATITSFWIGGGTAGLAILTAIIWLRHQDNIKRLVQKTESKLGQKDKT